MGQRLEKVWWFFAAVLLLEGQSRICGVCAIPECGGVCCFVWREQFGTACGVRFFKGMGAALLPCLLLSGFFACEVHTHGGWRACVAGCAAQVQVGEASIFQHCQKRRFR